MAIVGIVITTTAFYLVQKKRNSLAVDFYREWLRALDEKQLDQIKYRFPSDLIEGQIVDTLIQQRHQDDAEDESLKAV